MIQEWKDEVNMSHKQEDKGQEEIFVNDENERDHSEEEGVTETEEVVPDEKEEEINELKGQLKRLAAEFDNYKKRTLKEKEKIYVASTADVISAFLPVLDNMERALKASDQSDEQGIRDGVQLIHRQMKDIFSNMGISSIEAVGKTFNPDFHEAVMHVEDESYGESEIIEEFQKGYIYKDEVVIRHSVVKVAN